MAATTVETVSTPPGEARVTWHDAGSPRAVLALGHGAGGGIESEDLRALAFALPARGISVALVEVEGATHALTLPDAAVARVEARLRRWVA